MLRQEDRKAVYRRAKNWKIQGDAEAKGWRPRCRVCVLRPNQRGVEVQSQSLLSKSLGGERWFGHECWPQYAEKRVPTIMCDVVFYIGRRRVWWWCILSFVLNDDWYIFLSFCTDRVKLWYINLSHSTVSSLFSVFSSTLAKARMDFVLTFNEFWLVFGFVPPGIIYIWLIYIYLYNFSGKIRGFSFCYMW